MNRMIIITVAALALVTPSFGADLEGPAQGTVLAGPVSVTIEQAAAGARAVSMPPPIPAPNYTQVQTLKLQAPRPPVQQDAIIYMPPPGVTAEVPVLSRFFGLGQTEYPAPDPAIAAGLSEIVQVVNSNWAVFDKSGTQLAAGPLSGFFGPVDAPDVIYQPQVFFDDQEQRWVIAALGRSASTSPGGPEGSVWLLAVSQQSRAIGPWYVWKMDAGNTGAFSLPARLADDIAAGYNSMSLVLTANLYSAANPTFEYAQVRVLDKRELYKGRLRTFADFWALHDQNGRLVSSVRPMRAPLGASGFYLAAVAPDSGTFVSMWQYNGDATSPALARLPALRIRRFDVPTDASQRGTDVRLATGPVRLQSFQYLNGRMYCTFHETFPWTGDSRAAIRYLVIDATGASSGAPAARALSVAIDRTMGNGIVNYFNPSVAVDARGNAYFTFNFSNADNYAGIGYAGWPHNDTLSAPVILKQGEAPYGTSDPAPFGHVTAIALDPNAENAAWIAGAYARQNLTWGTDLAVLSVNPLRYQATVLPEGKSIPVVSDSLFKFGQTQPHWNAVGFRYGRPAQLEIWDANFLTLRARSSSPLPSVLTQFCVTDANHSRLDTMGVKLRYSGDQAAGMLQYSQATGSDALDPEQVNGPFNWQPTDVVKVNEYHSTPTTDTCFALTVSDGTANLGEALFMSPDAPYYADRYQAAATADENGPGESEYLTYRVLPDDYYAIVVWADNAADAAYAQSSACRIRNQPGPNASPDAFQMKLTGSGVMTTDAAIAYDVPRPTAMAIRVYDAGGRAIRTLVAANAMPGHYTITWDGRSATGRTLAAGAYFVRFESREFKTEQKIVKIK